jgi:hypothetical protein
MIERWLILTLMETDMMPGLRAVILITLLCCSTALSAARQAVGEIEVGRMPLGHVFLTTDELQIPITTSGQKVSWKLTDLFQKAVAMRTTPVRENRVIIRSPLRNGYFLLMAQALKDDRSITQTYVPFAVIPPHDVGDRDESPFGVMTHYAQGYDVDIFPLITKAGIINEQEHHDARLLHRIEPTLPLANDVGIETARRISRIAPGVVVHRAVSAV